MYSHSRIKAYEDCPRKFAYRYVEKVKVAQESTAEAFMGSMVHDALEHLYKMVEMERTPKWEELVAFYEDLWAKNWNDNILVVQPQFTGDDFRNVGRRCLMDYFRRFYPFRESRVLGLEEHLVFDLDDTGNYKIQGYVDRLAEADDGTIEIHDYKTGMRVPTQENVNSDRQLALYHIGIKQRLNDVKNVRLIWHYLRADRTLFSTRTPEALEELRTETIHNIDAIEEAKVREEFPPRESALCDWCEFRHLCPAKRHSVFLAGMEPEDYSNDAGVKLANAYAVAKRHLDEAADAVEAIRQRIIDYADKQNFTKLVGNGVTVQVSRQVVWKMPTMDDRNRTTLESLVRDSGLWEQVSDLSKSKLTKTIQSNGFDKVFKDQIAAFLKRDVTTIVRLTQKSSDPLDAVDS